MNNIRGGDPLDQDRCEESTVQEIVEVLESKNIQPRLTCSVSIIMLWGSGSAGYCFMACPCWRLSSTRNPIELGHARAANISGVSHHALFLRSR